MTNLGLGPAARRGIVRSRTVLIALVAFVLATAAACDADKTDRSSSPAPTRTTTHPATHEGASGTTGAAVAASPTERAAQFEQLLGQHVLLAVREMRGVVAAQRDFRQAADEALQENTETLSGLVASAYDEADGDRFKQLWQRATTNLDAYAEAAASDDGAAKQAARTALLADADAYGSWLAGAAEGRVRASDAAGDLRVHVEHLMRQVDAYADDDYDQAYKIERQAYEQLFMVGAPLAQASLTPKLAAKLDAPPEKLRSAFAMLLGEHMELIIEAQRATFGGSPEFKAAAAQVNANTTALTNAMGTIVGPQKAAEFQAAWGNHVEGLLAYSTAAADKDEAAKTAAEQNLDGFAARLALYFSDIVKNALPVEPLTEAISQHDTHLVGQVDAYAARDYSRAQEMELDGYQQMLGVAGTLVGAIQRTVKPGLPVGGSQTGGGGTAHPRR
jgi:hypothetical protein